MKRSLKAFMEGIIDYAGLFPPAGLSLETSLQNYADYRKTSDVWMLSRFIIPAAQLSELEPYKESLLNEKPPYKFSVLGKGTETVDEYKQQVWALVESLEHFHSLHEDQAITDVLEIKLPREAVLSHDANLLHEVFEETANVLSDAQYLPSRTFVEGFFEDSWKKDISLILDSLNSFNANLQKDHLRYIGYKLRCGGVKGDMFPSIEQVATILNAVRDRDIALKCTAGLHHPVRHYAEPVQTKMHGFFNVFGGGMLSYANDLSVEELSSILREEDPEQFQFADDGLRYRDWKVSTREISELREVAFLSYGSCSFDEPREDLRQLNLL